MRLAWTWYDYVELLREAGFTEFARKPLGDCQAVVAVKSAVGCGRDGLYVNQDARR